MQQHTDLGACNGCSRVITDHAVSFGIITSPVAIAEEIASSREVSPPRQRRVSVSVAGTERKFSWATQRITELTHDLEKADKKAKVGGMHLVVIEGCRSEAGCNTRLQATECTFHDL